MQTTLRGQDLGPLSLVAPTGAPRHLRGAHGDMWQWVGDGEELISLSVAVRESQLGTPTGVRHHLSWEVRQARAGLDPEPVASSVARVLIDVEGAVGAAAADVLGRVRGFDVHDRIIVMTDGAHMHVVRALVPDTPEGRELTERVTASLQVREWSMTP